MLIISRLLSTGFFQKFWPPLCTQFSWRHAFRVWYYLWKPVGTSIKRANGCEKLCIYWYVNECIGSDPLTSSMRTYFMERPMWQCRCLVSVGARDLPISVWTPICTGRPLCFVPYSYFYSEKKTVKKSYWPVMPPYGCSGASFSPRHPLYSSHVNLPYTL